MSNGLGNPSNNICIKEGASSGGVIVILIGVFDVGVVVCVDDLSPVDSLLQYKASEMIPNRPGRQFTPSFRSSISGPEKMKGGKMKKGAKFSLKN